MTFHDAAIKILSEAGVPLAAPEITRRAIEQSLLSHIGSAPETTMLARLVGMARRPRERRVMVTAKDTFALTDWNLPEDAEALATTGTQLTTAEWELPSLRPPERHPLPNTEFVRSTVRGGDRDRHREERRKRYPPLPGVLFEVLSDAPQGKTVAAAVADAKRRELAGDDLGPMHLLRAAFEDNRRRLDTDRRPQFVFRPTPEGLGEFVLEDGTDIDFAKIQEALSTVLAASGDRAEGGMSSDGGDKSDQGEVSWRSAYQEAVGAMREYRKTLSRWVAARVSSLASLEALTRRLLRGSGYREVRFVRRNGRNSVVLSARRREGSLDYRYVVHVCGGDTAVDRRVVQEARRSLQRVGAQVAIVVCPTDVRGDGQAEALSPRSELVALWCGTGFVERLVASRVGFRLDDSGAPLPDEEYFDALVESENVDERTSPAESAGGAPSIQESAEDEDEASAAATSSGGGGVPAPAGAGSSTEGEGRRRGRRRRRRGRRSAPDGSSAASGGGDPGGRDGNAQFPSGEAHAQRSAASGESPDRSEDSAGGPPPSPADDGSSA